MLYLGQVTNTEEMLPKFSRN